MRVAHIITRLILGGAQENTILNCHDLLSDYADEVLLITGPARGPEGELESMARGRGVPVRVIDSLRREIHPWRDWRSYAALGQILREFAPEVVHTHSAKAGILGRRAAWSLGVPAIVHTVHGAPFHPYESWVNRRFAQFCERDAAGRCHALISVADAMTDRMVEAKIAPAEKFTTIYSGMEIEPFLEADRFRLAERAARGFSEEHIVIGKIARFFPLKGHEYLLEAARQVIQQVPTARFLLVGDGILHDHFQRQVRKQGLADHVQFTGLAPRTAIPRLLSATDIMVHTSLREGLARVLPQSLLAGKPVVSFDIDGAREVVRDGETGFLVVPQDTAGLAQAIVRLATSTELRAELAATGRRLCREPFDHRTMTCRIRALYARLLEQSRAAVAPPRRPHNSP